MPKKGKKVHLWELFAFATYKWVSDLNKINPPSSIQHFDCMIKQYFPHLFCAKLSFFPFVTSVNLEWFFVLILFELFHFIDFLFFYFFDFSLVLHHSIHFVSWKGVARVVIQIKTKALDLFLLYCGRCIPLVLPFLLILLSSQFYYWNKNRKKPKVIDAYYRWP